MGDQIRGMHERARAEVALVAPLARVRPDVDEQVVLALEPLMALGAFVGPIGRWHERDRLVVLEVGQHVLLQLVRAVEGERADLAPAIAAGGGALGAGICRSGAIVAAAVRRGGFVVDR